MSDFFDLQTGLASAFKARSRLPRRLLDRIYDARLSKSDGLASVRRDAMGRAAGRILIVGVEVPTRPADIHDVVERLRSGSRHETGVSVVPMGDRGKFQNVDKAIRESREPLASFDWLVAVDDDIRFARGFLDDLVALAQVGDLGIAQPAHAFESHTSYAITRRKWNSLARQTAFVEIGPLTLIRADAFATFIPFPESRWGYGIDVLWSELAERHGHRMGIVDGTPVRHLRPVANSYGMEAAIAEGRALLSRYQVTKPRSELWKNRIIVPTRG